MVFQAHDVRQVLILLENSFSWRIFNWKDTTRCPSRSPNLTSMIFFLVIYQAEYI